MSSQPGWWRGDQLRIGRGGPGRDQADGAPTGQARLLEPEAVSRDVQLQGPGPASGLGEAGQGKIPVNTLILTRRCYQLQEKCCQAWLIMTKRKMLIS